jgi:hypothetical protein
MAKEEKNYEPIIFMNTPIMNKDDDVIGISSSVDAILHWKMEQKWLELWLNMVLENLALRKC